MPFVLLLLSISSLCFLSPKFGLLPKIPSVNKPPVCSWSRGELMWKSCQSRYFEQYEHKQYENASLQH